MSNLPPGVNGSEYQIAGPDSEWETLRWCQKCEAETMHTFNRYGYEVWRICDECELQTDEEPEEPDEPDDRCQLEIERFRD